MNNTFKNIMMIILMVFGFVIIILGLVFFSTVSDEIQKQQNEYCQSIGYEYYEYENKICIGNEGIKYVELECEGLINPKCKMENAVVK